MSDIAPWSVAVHEGVGSLAGSAGNDTVHVQVTSIVPIGVPLAPVLLFESTPVPVRICCGPCCDCCSGDPVPAPQATASTAKSVAVMIVRTGLMTPPRSPLLTGNYRVNS